MGPEAWTRIDDATTDDAAEFDAYALRAADLWDAARSGETAPPRRRREELAVARNHPELPL